MSEQRTKNDQFLTNNALLYGFVSAFDMYGVRGRKLNARIQKRWRRIMDQPRKSTEDTVRDGYLAVASKYRDLLMEHGE